jgi:opacity protein-like surface antigen
VRTLALALALATSSAARAEEAKPVAQEKPTHAWELDAFAGYGQLAYPPMDTAGQTWSNGGPAFALTVAYRGPHFTHPFFDISYVPIISSGGSVYLPGSGPGTSTYASNSTWAWGFVLGPGWDIDWFRIRAGVGIYDVHVQTTVLGQTNTSSQLSIGFLASAGALVWRPEPFALGIEARLAALQSPTSGIYQSSWEIGLTGRWDFVHHR